MKFCKLLAAVLLSLTLSACFHIQLNGSVGDGSLIITPLRDPTNILQSQNSVGPAAYVALWGQEDWDALDALVRLISIGVVSVKPTDLDPNALYLMTASGGLDYAPDGGADVSDDPADVQGEWHAIATGERIMAGNIKVSTLSEALYLQLKNRLGEYTDAEITARLEAAAQLVLLDVDGNETVDYDDVMHWNRTLDAARYRGDIADLDALGSAVTAGQPEATLMGLAETALATQKVGIQTNFGAIEIETLNWGAPLTVVNFLDYVAANFYDQVIFHRVINGFMIQTGIWEYLGDRIVDQKTPSASIVNESSSSVSNLRGTLSMARTSDPNSAASQFFINQVDNTFLDHGSSENPDGYTVFARVTSGMDVVEAIAALPTTAISGIGSDVPRQLVLIESVELLD
jgi:peptidyl-prolyl cis-trans isomerase A (cyclophilin A)